MTNTSRTVSPMTPGPQRTAILASLLLLITLAGPVLANTPTPHTDPLNLTPEVRDAHVLFYNLDYDSALARFQAIQRANPTNPMATNYVLFTLVFRELYHQDLLDTTYYAHDSFLTSKRNVPVPAATRQRIEYLTDTGIRLADDRIRAN